ncbi:MAG: hypothetical protein WCA11_15575 [Terracidiphilus sp.]
MSKIGPIMLGLSLAFAGTSMAAAQDAATSTAPVILQITREFTKPYKGGAANDKTESAFIEAQTKAQFPAYYVAMNSMTGKARALFMTRYSSFAEWEKDNKIIETNHALGAEMESAGIADGELLDSVDSEVFTLNRELSYHSHNDLANHRFYQIMVFHVKPGHHKDWVDVVNMVKAAHDKMGDSAHWGMYQVAFGTEDGTYIAITGDPTMAVIDQAFADGKKFVEAMGGEEGMAKLDALFGAAVDSSHTELFAINPRQSYVSEDWIKTDPAFWKPSQQ